MLEGLHHVALIASDYDASKRFYTKVLGLEVIAETYRKERGSWKLDLQVPGGGQLELFSFPNPTERPTRPEACGLRHLAFRVSNLDAIVEHLRSHQVFVHYSYLFASTGHPIHHYRIFQQNQGVEVLVGVFE